MEWFTKLEMPIQVLTILGCVVSVIAVCITFYNCYVEYKTIKRKVIDAQQEKDHRIIREIEHEEWEEKKRQEKEEREAKKRSKASE